MSTKLRMIGLAVFAITAIMAVSGVASASAFTNFNAETAPVKLTGTQTETATFTTSAGSITCTEGSFLGESASTKTETVETSLSYGGCRFLGFIGVNVVPHSCKYKFHASGTADVVNCPSTAPIEFEAAGCKVTVANQTGLTSIGYANTGTGSGRDVIVSPNVTNIIYSTTSSCPGGAHTNATGGKYTGGKATVVGKTTAGKADGVFVS